MKNLLSIAALVLIVLAAMLWLPQPEPAAVSATTGGAFVASGVTVTSPCSALDLMSNSTRWMAAADDYLGGASRATSNWNQTAAANTLQVSGRLEPGYAFPYAGAMWLANDIPMQPADCSDQQQLLLHIDGAAGAYQVLLFSGASQAGQPQQVPITIGQLNRIDLDAINGLDLTRLRAIGVFATGDAGEVSFRIVEARLQ